MFLLSHQSVLTTAVFQLNISIPYSTDLEKMMKKTTFTNVDKNLAIYQIAQGMKYIHSHNIVHLNLSPSSVFVLPDRTIKIGGFEKMQLTNFIENKSEIELKIKSDVFSFGLIVYFILSDGKMPFSKNKINVKSFPLLAGQLIDSCCNTDISTRPTFEIICDVLEENYYNIIPLSQHEFDEISIKMIKYKNEK